MEERKYSGDVEFSKLFTDMFKSRRQIKEAINNPENKTVIIHKEGSRTVHGDVVYECQDGEMVRIGLSWQNTTETIQECEKK